VYILNSSAQLFWDYRFWWQPQSIIRRGKTNQLLQSSASMAALRSIAIHGEKRAAAPAPSPKLQAERIRGDTVR